MKNVSYSNSVAVRIRYLGPSNTRGSRFRVFRSDGTYNEDPDRMEIPFDHGLSSSERPVALLKTYLMQKGDGWDGNWIVAGASDSEYVGVRT